MLKVVHFLSRITMNKNYPVIFSGAQKLPGKFSGYLDTRRKQTTIEIHHNGYFTIHIQAKIILYAPGCSNISRSLSSTNL